MLHTKTHHLSKFGIAANITLVATFSLLTVFLISHRQDIVSSPEGARNSGIVQTVSLEEVPVSMKDTGGEITHGL